mmetsp:Transcript_8534/g.35591  ORF Transcript_8534/g.35591 Transcript_8534/m.35591 type:complete len:442 (-) Transcript_8534:36-1361(-)
MAVDSLQVLQGLPLAELLAKFPTPPSQAPVAKASAAARAPGAVPRRSSVPYIEGLQWDHTAMLGFAVAPELEGESRKKAFAMLLQTDRAQLNDNLAKVYEGMVDSSGIAALVRASSSGEAAANRKGTFSKLKKMRSRTASSSGGSKSSVAVSKNVLDFGLSGALCPLKEDMQDEVTVSLKAGKSCRFHVVLPPPNPTYSLSVTPDAGQIKKKADVVLQVTLNIKSTILLEDCITLEVPGVGRYFFVIRLQSETSVFGQDITQFLNRGKGLVPPVLEQLKAYLTEHGGMEQEQIFLRPGDEVELLAIKDQLNREVFEECKDLHCIATLILTWFRELSAPLLSPLSENLLLSATGEYECLSLMDMMKEPQKTILVWLLELMGDVQVAKDKNGVDPEKLAELVAATIYTPASADAAKNEKLPGKVVNLLNHLVAYRLKLRQRSM